MKRQNLILILASIIAVFGAGCVTGRNPLPPSFYSLGTSTAVALALHDSPQTADYLRAIQPVVCSLSIGREVTPSEIALAVQNFGVADSPEAAAVVNSVLMLYIVAFNSAGTNGVPAQLYAEAIFCDGLATGLGGSPTAARLRAQPPPPTGWPLLRRN